MLKHLRISGGIAISHKAPTQASADGPMAARASLGARRRMKTGAILGFFAVALGGGALAQQAAEDDGAGVFSAQGLAGDIQQVRNEQPVVIAAGPAGNMNFVTAGLLCEVMSRQMGAEAPPCYVQATAGSSANVQALIDGTASLALVQSDREYFAAEQQGPYKDVEAASRLRRIVALSGLPIQVIVKATGGYETLSDLAGARVGLGVEGSAQRIIGRVILSTADVPERELTEINTLRPSEQVRDFCANELDAVILPTTAPSPLVTELTQRRCNGKLLSLETEAFNRLTENNSYLVPLQLPADTYTNQTENIATLGYVVSLLGTAGQRTEIVEALASELSLVYGSLASRYDGIGMIPEDKLFDLGRTAPLHQGVQNYLDQGPGNDDAVVGLSADTEGQ